MAGDGCTPGHLANETHVSDGDGAVLLTYDGAQRHRSQDLIPADIQRRGEEGAGRPWCDGIRHFAAGVSANHILQAVNDSWEDGERDNVD